MNEAAILARKAGQVQLPEELRADVSAQGLWKWGTTAVFDIQIVKLNAGSYLCMTPEKDIAKEEKENKDL